MPTYLEFFCSRSLISAIISVCLLDAITFATNTNASDSDNTKLPTWQFTSELPFTIHVFDPYKGTVFNEQTPGTVEIPKQYNPTFIFNPTEANLLDYAREIKKHKLRQIEINGLTGKSVVRLVKTGCLANVESLNLAFTPTASFEDYMASRKANKSPDDFSDLTPLAELDNLKILSLIGYTSISDLKSLTKLKKLDSLCFADCPELSDLKPLGNLQNLKTLCFMECKKLSNIDSLESMVNLEGLMICECPKISDLTPIASLINLRELDLSTCNNISDLTPLAKLKNLEALNLIDCKQVSDLTPLTGLTHLKRLELSDTKVSDLTPLTNLTNLQELMLTYCCNVSDLKPLIKLKNLWFLDIEGCDKIPKSEIFNLQKKSPKLKVRDNFLPGAPY